MQKEITTVSELKVGDSFQVKYENRWSNNFRVWTITDVSYYLNRPAIQIERTQYGSLILSPDALVKVARA